MKASDTHVSKDTALGQVKAEASDKTKGKLLHLPIYLRFSYQNVSTSVSYQDHLKLEYSFTINWHSIQFNEKAGFLTHFFCYFL